MSETDFEKFKKRWKFLEENHSNKEAYKILLKDLCGYCEKQSNFCMKYIMADLVSDMKNLSL